MFFNFPGADTRLASVWCLDKLFGGIAGLLVDIEISITDLRNAVYPAEFDCLISAEPQHRVGDLSAALLSLRSSGYGAPGGPGGPSGWHAETPGPPGTPGTPALWLDGAQLDPAVPLASSGIRAGARLGFGGPSPGGCCCVVFQLSYALWNAAAAGPVHVPARSCICALSTDSSDSISPAVC
jgi:hypothetical protein